MSGTSTNRSRGHRSVGVGDSDLEAVKRLHRRRALRRTFASEDKSGVPMQN
ncbi:MAG: hypothetical protein K2H04_09190 [Bacteroidaceae bacterium]|nr:hypothetical protein [Bacteroidaceae bacterium]